MQLLKITAILILGIVVFSSKTNATELRQESKLRLAQANRQDTAKYFNSGIKRLEQGNYRGAIADFTKAIQINPKLVAAYYNRAIARHQLQNYQRAIADFTKVIQINPNYADAYYNRDVARGFSGDEAAGMTDLQKAISMYRNQGEEAKSQKLVEFTKIVSSK